MMWIRTMLRICRDKFTIFFFSFSYVKPVLCLLACVMSLLYACAHADYSIVTSICDQQFQCQFRTTDFLRVSVSKNTLRKLPAFSKRKRERKYFGFYWDRTRDLWHDRVRYLSCHARAHNQMTIHVKST